MNNNDQGPVEDPGELLEQMDSASTVFNKHLANLLHLSDIDRRDMIDEKEFFDSASGSLKACLAYVNLIAPLIMRTAAHIAVKSDDLGLEMTRQVHEWTPKMGDIDYAG